MKPVFVVGTARSGSTVTARALAAHPSVFKFKGSEPKFFCGLNGFNGFCLNLYRNTANDGLFFHWANNWYRRVEKRADGTDVSTGIFEELPEKEFKDICQEYWEATRAAKADWDIVVPAIRRAYERIFSLIDPKGEKTHFIDDTPFNAMRVREIAAVFPDALILHMIRDGRMVASSLMRLGWAASFQEGLYQWKARLDHARALARALDLPRERYLEVDFAKLREDTDATFADIFEVAGLEYDPKYKVAARFDADVANRYEPPASETAYFRELAGDLIEEFGWE